MAPRISVIIPVYNQQRYLSETIESVLNQTFTDFELILIDDGSKDTSSEIIYNYASKDIRIIPIIQANSGKPNAINTASLVAKGEYLAFMDHDDLMLHNRLEKQILFHEENPTLCASSCHCYYIDENNNLMGTQKLSGPKTIEEYHEFIKRKEIMLCAFTGLIVRKNSFISCGGLKTKFWPCDDLEFFNRFIDKGYSLIINQEILMKYRAHSSSTTIANAWEVYVTRNDYTRSCIVSRRANQLEISYDDFLEKESNKPWIVKLNRKKKFYAMILQKEAGFAMFTKKYVSFFWKISLATILYPTFIMATIRKRLL